MEMIGNLLIAVSFGQVTQDSQLAGAELNGRLLLLKLSQHAGGNGGIHKAAATLYGTDGTQHIYVGRVFENVTPAAGREHGADVGRIIVHGQDYNARGRGSFANFREGDRKSTRLNSSHMSI